MTMIKIIVGTETGTAEFVADDIEALLEKQQLEAEITLEPDEELITTSNNWLICTSTHGAGDIPNNLQPFHNLLLANKPDLSHINYMIIGLGDSSYDRFCGAAEALNSTLKDLNAKPLIDVFKVDAMDDDLPEDLVIPYLEQHVHLFK